MNQSFTTKELNSIFEAVAQDWFRRFRSEYQRVDLFSKEDLAQELWAEWLASGTGDPEKFASKMCNRVRMRGSRRPVEIPVSQLGDQERAEIENLFYASGTFDDENAW